MKCRDLDNVQRRDLVIGNEDLPVIILDGLLSDPQAVIDDAALQYFAHINPHYPGVRAPLEPASVRSLCDMLAPALSSAFLPTASRWEAQCWYSIVTTAPSDLAPIQRLPHVDGTDPDQIAMMLYLHDTDHGGTAFYRHRATGLESLSAETFPRYKARLEAEVAKTGLPAPAYIGDGAPHFERIHAAEGIFNRAILYRGNCFHSGMIDNQAPLPADPRTGRLTINAFIRPVR